MSEVDVNGCVLHSFTDVSRPLHLSLDSEGHVFVADYDIDRVLLLSSKLQLQRVLIDTNSQVKLWRPTRLCYNELTAQLYVVHSSEEWSVWSWKSNVISVFSLHWVIVSQRCSLLLSLNHRSNKRFYVFLFLSRFYVFVTFSILSTFKKNIHWTFHQELW